jgi:hypothetical protein
VNYWKTQFIRGDFSTCDAPRPDRRKTVTTPENIDLIQRFILKDQQQDFGYDNS